jgi:hypothetical protein
MHSIYQKLPSNKNFGILFAFIFFIAALYFYINDLFYLFICSIVISFAFLSISIFLPNHLSFFNKLWFRFGILLGRIISPVVLGVIFSFLIIPTALIIRLMGRDELRLKASDTKTYWISRLNDKIKPDSFKNQF